MESKTILVTGVAGFIGSQVTDKFLEKGNHVIGLDNFNDFYSPELKRKNISHLLSNSKFELVEADIRKPRIFDTLFRKYDVDSVVHLAARAGVRPSLENPQLYWDVNVMGSLNLLESMKLNKIEQLVFASSSSVYGNRTNGPFKETDNTDHQISPYGATKKALEVMAATYASLYKIHTTGLRFFTVYGPRNRPQMACSNFIEALETNSTITKYGDGSTGRDYTYIDDICSGIVAATDKALKYEIINLGNSSPVLLNELIETLATVTGKKPKINQKPIQPGDVEFTFADISKAKKLLGWSPNTSLKDGLTKTVKWYRDIHQ